jgi:hypothetical protein
MVIYGSIIWLLLHGKLELSIIYWWPVHNILARQETNKAPRKPAIWRT